MLLELAQSLSARWQRLMARADPRVDSYFLMTSVWPTVIISAAYVFVVLQAGPLAMRNRKNFELRVPMIVYNACMVALSGYMVFEFCASGWLAGYKFTCQQVDYSGSAQAIRMINVLWYFYISKFIEFIDTIFFVLRKKSSQITFLHVFHHAAMPFPVWWGVKFAPGGSGSFFCLLNSFIHFVMYTYYGLSAFGPRVQKYLWWKKYMTSLQMIQFVLICFQSGCVLYSGCAYPVPITCAIFSYGAAFLVLFTNFYTKTYQHEKNKQNKLSKQPAVLEQNGLLKHKNKVTMKYKDKVTMNHKHKETMNRKDKVTMNHVNKGNTNQKNGKNTNDKNNINSYKKNKIDVYSKNVGNTIQKSNIGTNNKDSKYVDHNISKITYSKYANNTNNKDNNNTNHKNNNTHHKNSSNTNNNNTHSKNINNTVKGSQKRTVKGNPKVPPKETTKTLPKETTGTSSKSLTSKIS